MKLNLRGKFMLPTLGVVVLGMIISTYISFSSSRTALRDSIEASMKRTAHQMAGQIDSWVTDINNDVKQVAERDSVIQYFQDPSDANTASVTEYLKNFDSSYGYYQQIGLVNTKGIISASSLDQGVGTDITSRDYYKNALQGKSEITDALLSKTTGSPIFVVAHPVFDKSKKVIGICIGVVDLALFSKAYIDDVKIGQKGYAYLMDTKGILIAHPNKEHIKNQTNLAAKYDWGKKIIDTAHSKGADFQEYEWEGAMKMVAFENIKTTGWVVSVGAENSDIFGSVTKIRNLNIVISLIMVVAVGLVIFLIVASIVSSVKIGVSFADKIGKGDITGRLKMQRADEIGILANALDSMADGLEGKVNLAGAIAAGDLSRDIIMASDNDALGIALQTMTESLNDIIRQIIEAANQITAGSSQVSDASQSLSQGATESAASIEEITSSMTEMGSQTKQNAENASQANQLATSARDAAERGNNQMQQMVTAMGEINVSSQEISKIIKVIDDIAFQTNLLALNAAVEAARAGRHGKGFAVVAEEVRNLAARSAKAARETAELIEGSVKRVENGMEIAGHTADALKEIVGGITKATDLVGEIAAASNEQAQGIAQVNIGLHQIDSVTQQNTANAEETAAAAEELSSQAVATQQILTRFTLKGSSGNQSYAPSTLPSPAKPSLPKKTAGGWDDMNKKDKPSTVIKPSDVIDLDDKEFGKF